MSKVTHERVMCPTEERVPLAALEALLRQRIGWGAAVTERATRPDVDQKTCPPGSHSSRGTATGRMTGRCLDGRVSKQRRYTWPGFLPELSGRVPVELSNQPPEAPMHKIFCAAACALALAAPAYAQSVPEKTGVNSTLGISPSTQDFVTQAAISDMLEIDSSKLAQARADAKSRQFAGKMVKDHTGTSSELKALVKSGKVKATLPRAMDSAHQAKLDKLKGLKGADFDKEYDELQISAHKDAVSLFERYSKGGDNAALKAFASKHLPHLQQHLKMANDLQNAGTTGKAAR
jgi:putative membrane protein